VKSHRQAILTVLGLLLLSACGQQYPQSTLAPLSDASQEIQDLFVSIFWWAVLVFVVVEGLLVFAIYRFRHRGDDRTPQQVHGHTLMEIGWTLAPAVILVMIAVPTIRSVWILDLPSPDPAALDIEVIGHQWWWEFRYPEQEIVTANELHVPVGRTVNLSLESADVIHSFWFPRASGKRDVVPGHRNELWFKFDSAGTYPGQCAEFCGESHALMKMLMVAAPQQDFEAWVARQQQPAAEPATELAREGREEFLRSACIGCHRVAGTAAQGIVGPDLTHIGSRQKIAAGILDNTPENMARWLRDPESVKPGVLMPKLALTDEQIEKIAAYLESLK
jgi:cytochrome c oxidase subunit 2